MKISNDGLAIVKAFEGCLKPIGNGKYVPYICPAGVLTIGWGHTRDSGRYFDKHSVWTTAECDMALAEDMGTFEAAVSRRVKVPLNQHQFDALVSFTYNCGEGNLAKSTLLKRVNAGDFAGAAAQFAAWNKGGGKVLAGLTRRRKSESFLFKGNIIEAYRAAGVARAEGEMPQLVDLPAPQEVDLSPLPPDIHPVIPAEPPFAPQQKSLWADLFQFVRDLFRK